LAYHKYITDIPSSDIFAESLIRRLRNRFAELIDW